VPLSPDLRQHRGAHPADKEQFSKEQILILATATAELSWLLTRQYKMAAALKLVGDRYALTTRQRLAVSRATCSDQSLRRRHEHRISLEHIENGSVVIDGFNLIITVEAALSGGVLLVCRDDCIRDLSSVHGSYRSVQETERSMLLIGEALENLKPASVRWFLDRPVSNSGRLARRITDLASQHCWPWSVEVIFNPDTAIISSSSIAITSDSSILDRVEGWVNLNPYLVEQLPGSWLLDFRISC